MNKCYNDITLLDTFQGSPQWVQIGFPDAVQVEAIHIKFQGGFVGQDCSIEGMLAEGGHSQALGEFYPEDINSLQVSLCNDNFLNMMCIAVITHITVIYWIVSRHPKDLFEIIELHHVMVLDLKSILHIHTLAKVNWNVSTVIFR